MLQRLLKRLEQTYENTKNYFNYEEPLENPFDIDPLDVTCRQLASPLFFIVNFISPSLTGDFS